MNILRTLWLIMLMVLVPCAQGWPQISDGIHKEYYADGTIRKEAQYKGGRQEGYSREYYPNGRLAFTQFVHDGKINGPVKAYYESGALQGEASYVDNLENGLVKEYYETGSVKEEVMYVRGSIINLKRFDEQGRLVFNQDSNFPLGCVIDASDEPEQ